MTDIDFPALDRELKKGAAELLLLSVLEERVEVEHQPAARPRFDQLAELIAMPWSGVTAPLARA